VAERLTHQTRVLWSGTVTIHESREPSGGMGPEVCLFEHADTDPIPHASPHEVLQVEG